MDLWVSLKLCISSLFYGFVGLAKTVNCGPWLMDLPALFYGFVMNLWVDLGLYFAGLKYIGFTLNCALPCFMQLLRTLFGYAVAELVRIWNAGPGLWIYMSSIEHCGWICVLRATADESTGFGPCLMNLWILDYICRLTICRPHFELCIADLVYCSCCGPCKDMQLPALLEYEMQVLVYAFACLLLYIAAGYVGLAGFT